MSQKTEPAVSPLAPKTRPQIAPVAGVTLAAGAAGVRYEGRTDVMLARVAPGSAMAGVFTRSSTRSAPVLWCQDALAKAGPVRLAVYDVRGRLVQTLEDRDRQPGTYEVEWDATRVAAGTYVYRLTSGDESKVRRMTVVR